MVEGYCGDDFRDQGRASGRRLRRCREVVRRGAGPAFSARHVKPRLITEQGGRDLKRTLELGFSLFGGAALLMAGSLGLAMGQVNCDTLPAGPARTDCYIGLGRI